MAVAAVTALLCLAVFLKALQCGFVNWDDLGYVVQNRAIRHLDGKLIAWACSSYAIDLWMPLTWLSFAVDYHFWGVNPLGYHLTNILLHAVNTGIVVLIADELVRSTGGEGLSPRLRAGMLLAAGLLWGIHPLRVESVAWVAERKDVLNGLFTLGAVFCYLRYVRWRETGAGRSSWLYLASLALFACSLMAKPVSVVVPAMLLVLDWYPLQRQRQERLPRILAEKVPFFLLSFAFSALSLYVASRLHILASMANLSFVERILVSGNALFEYIRLELVPTDIVPLYVIPAHLPLSYTVHTIVVVSAALLSIAACRQRAPAVVTWFLFLLPLLPVLAFFQNADQAYAARYTYLPSVAPCIVVAIAAGRACAKRRRLLRVPLVTALLAVTVWYAVTTERLIGIWKNTGTLWTRVIEYHPLGRSYFNRGCYYYETGNYAAAIADFSAAIGIAAGNRMPLIYYLYAFRGAAYLTAGLNQEAVGDFTTAIEMYPRRNYYHFRGIALQRLGRDKEAAEDFRRSQGDATPIQWYWE